MNDLCFYKIKGADVLNNIVNLKQLVFEVTDACNLKCKYCGFGDMYDGYDKRESMHMSFEKVKLVINYLVKIWEKNNQNDRDQLTVISFYGGEPLLNIPLIEKTIDYIESFDRSRLNKQFRFSMTTNAVLLDKYMDYLVEKNFMLLISLDGNEESQSYRVDHAGNNSFDKVFKNVKLLQEKYPDYFSLEVNFNAVLHDRNNVANIFRFIKKEFGKTPLISEINSLNIIPEMRDEFYKTFRNKRESISQNIDPEKISDEILIQDPDIFELYTFLNTQSKNMYRNYNELLFESENIPILGSGTCMPFNKKMYITVGGKILPCEKIDYQFSYGNVSDQEVNLNVDEISFKFNALLEKITPQCISCYSIRGCMQCIYMLDDILASKNPKCRGYADKKIRDKYFEKNMTYLSQHPHLLKTLSYKS